ncbi:MFS transporter [Agarivorans gilvus]|uniref:MFS transporter n=1 Tax=Agarivorans gilvus TaxID=680279 RepID=A0ABQ1I1K4_9ALTE|nr:MFS transporter [Agarivorans gilvus]GGB06153.1 MFS transporter [Agarivorans gilvus]
MLTLSERSALHGIFSPLLGLALFSVASGYLMSLIPLALVSFSLSEALSPWLASAYFGGLLLGALKAQRLISRCLHRVSFIICLVTLLASVLLMYFFPHAAAWLVLRAIAGAATAGIFVVVESWLLLVDNDKQRTTRLALYMITLYAGNALGQLLISAFGVSGLIPFMLVSGLLALALIAPLFTANASVPAAQHQSLSLSDIARLSKTGLIACLVSGLVLGPIYGLLPSYISQFTNWKGDLGLLMAGVILGGVLVQPLCGRLSANYNKTLLQAVIAFIGVAAALSMLLAETSFSLAVSLFVLGGAAFSLYPIAISQACLNQSTDKIVAITEMMLIIYSLGSIAGPLVAELASDSLADLPYYFGAILGSSTVYMLLMLAKGAGRRHIPPTLDV